MADSSKFKSYTVPLFIDSQKTPSEGILIVIATIYGYSLSYLYELGYSHAFDYPPSLIKINISSMIYTIGITLLIFAIVYLISWVMGLVILIAMNYAIKRIKWLNNFFRSTSVSNNSIYSVDVMGILLVAIYFIARHRGYLFTFLEAFLVVIFIIIMVFISVVLRTKITVDSPVMERYIDGAIEERKNDRRVNFTVIIFLLFALPILYCGYLLGNDRARHKENFYAFSDLQVLIRVYDDTYITKKYKISKKSFGGDGLKVRKIKDDEAVSLHRIKITKLNNQHSK